MILVSGILQTIKLQLGVVFRFLFYFVVVVVVATTAQKVHPTTTTTTHSISFGFGRLTPVIVHACVGCRAHFARLLRLARFFRFLPSFAPLS